MLREDPQADAEWMMETVLDEFAQSMSPSQRVLFYARLAQLALERCNREARDSNEFDSGSSTDLQ